MFIISNWPLAIKIKSERETNHVCDKWEDIPVCISWILYSSDTPRECFGILLVLLAHKTPWFLFIFLNTWRDTHIVPYHTPYSRERHAASVSPVCHRRVQHPLSSIDAPEPNGGVHRWVRGHVWIIVGRRGNSVLLCSHVPTPLSAGAAWLGEPLPEPHLKKYGVEEPPKLPLLFLSSHSLSL